VRTESWVARSSRSLISEFIYNTEITHQLAVLTLSSLSSPLNQSPNPLLVTKTDTK